MLLAIENPESPGVDMGRNSHQLPKIKRAFEHAHRVLLYALSDRKVVSYLPLLIRVDDPTLALRVHSAKRSQHAAADASASASTGGDDTRSSKHHRNESKLAAQKGSSKINAVEIDRDSSEEQEQPRVGKKHRSK